MAASSSLQLPPTLVRRRSDLRGELPLGGSMIGSDVWKFICSFLDLEAHVALFETCRFFRGVCVFASSWPSALVVGGYLPWRKTGECVARAPPVDAGIVTEVWTHSRRSTACWFDVEERVPLSTDWATDEVIRHVCCRPGDSGLRALDLAGCWRLGPATLAAAAARLRRPEFLGLRGVHNLTGEALLGVLPALAGLVHLDLGDCRLLESADMVPCLRVVGPTLVSLNLAGCTLITDATARAIAEFAPGVVQVALSRTYVTWAGLHALGEGCPQLEVLEYAYVEVSTEALAAVASGCPRLRRVDLSGTSHLVDGGLARLAKCRSIEWLKLRYCEYLSWSVLRMMASLPMMRGLDLQGCKNLVDSVFLDRAVRLDGLQVLSLENCSLLSDAVVVRIASECSQLVSISLARCHVLTDASLLALAKRPGLRRLDVAWTKAGMSDAGVEAVCQGCPLLTDLVLNGNSRFGDRSVLAAARNLCHLRVLGLEGLNLGDRAVAELARCAQLGDLRLAGCSLLTDAALLPVVGSCRKLTFLSVSHCPRLTHAAAAEIVTLDHLRFLRMQGCSEAFVREVGSRRRDLIIDEDDDGDEAFVSEMMRRLFEE